MSQTVHIELQSRTVTNVQVAIHPEKRPAEKAPLKASFQAKLGLPKEERDRSFLLACTMHTVCEQEPDFFDATLEANYIFLCNETAENSDDVIAEQSVPVVQKQMMELLKTILADMGYEKFFKE